MGTEILSSPRRAFERAASSILARRMPSSNSLMLPFIPSNKRSLGELIEVELAGGYRVRVGDGVNGSTLRLVLDVLERR